MNQRSGRPEVPTGRAPILLAVQGPELPLDDVAARQEACGLLGKGVRELLDGDTLLLWAKTNRTIAAGPGLRAVAEQVRSIFGRSGQRSPAWVGAAAGDHVPLSRWRDTRSGRALLLGKALWPAGRTVLYEDVCFFDHISRDRELLELLCAVLEPLEELPDRKRHEVLEAVEAFFDTDLSQIRAARHLIVHRITLIRRLDLAELVLSRSVRHSPDRLLVELAIKARRLAAGR